MQTLIRLMADQENTVSPPEEKVDLGMSAVLIQSLVKVFQDCLGQLPQEQWQNFELGQIDQDTESIITSMCTNLIFDLSNHFYQTAMENLSQESHDIETPGSRGSIETPTSLIAATKVREALGDNLSLALTEAMGVPEVSSHHSAKRINVLVAKEVAESVNSMLSSQVEGGDGRTPQSQLNTHRLNRIAQHVIKVLQNFAHKCVFKCLWNSNPDEATVKIILDKLSSDACERVREDLSPEEFQQLESVSSRRAESVASDIHNIIQEGNKGEGSGSPHPSPKKPSFWTRVERKIKAFILRLFATESVIKIVAKIRARFVRPPEPEEQPPFSDLLESVDTYVETISHPQEDQKKNVDEECLYKQIADDSYTVQSIQTWLNDKIFKHVQNGSDLLHMYVEVDEEVRSFTEQVQRWLNEQIDMSQADKDKASQTLQKIKGIQVILPETERSRLASWGEEPAAIVRGEDSTSSAHRLSAHFKRECYQMMATVVARIIDNKPCMLDDVHTYDEITSSLTEMLCARIQGCSSIVVGADTLYHEQIAKTVHKDLCKALGTSMVVLMFMCSRKQYLYELIIQSLVRHLEKPKATGRSHLVSFCRSVVKRLSAAGFPR